MFLVNDRVCIILNTDIQLYNKKANKANILCIIQSMSSALPLLGKSKANGAQNVAYNIIKMEVMCDNKYIISKPIIALSPPPMYHKVLLINLNII